MSQEQELYDILLKIHTQMYEFSMKTIELIEREKSIDSNISLSDEQSKLVKIAIEKLNLIHVGTHIDQIGDNVMNNNKIDVSVGDNANISGNFVVGNSIQNCFNRIDSSASADDLKGLLKELSAGVGKMTEQISDGEKEDLIDYLNRLIDEATQKKPKRRWWEMCVEGLSKAAQNIGDVGKPVLELLGKIIPILTNLSI